MSTTTTEPSTGSPLELFTATCEAAGIPAGATRLDIFLALPEAQQDGIWAELVAPADGGGE